MSTTHTAVRFDGVDADLGARIKERRVAIGMSVKGLAEQAKVDRGRLAALENGDPTVRETTVGAVESALTRLEHEMGMNDIAPASEAESMVEFRVTGNFGVDVVVKGPIGDMAAMEESVGRLVAKMQTQPDRP